MDFDFKILGEVEKGRSPQIGGYTLTATPSKNVRVSNLTMSLLEAQAGDEITAFEAVVGSNKRIVITKAIPSDSNRAKLTAVSKENPDLIQFSHSRLWGMLEGHRAFNIVWQVNQTAMEKDGRKFFLLENPEKIAKINRTKKADKEVENDSAVQPKAEYVQV